MQIKTEVTLNGGNADRIFSITTQKYIEVDGVRHNLGEPHTISVVPDDYETVEQNAPELLPEFKKLWSKPVVAAFKAKMEAAPTESNTEIQTESTFDSGTIDRVFSIKTQQYMEIDGVRHEVGDSHRIAVAPGDFETVEQYAPELLPMFKELWNKPVVSAFKAKMEAIQKDEMEG